MSFQNQSFTFGDTLPSSDVSQLQDNVVSVASGGNGAPPFVPAAFENSILSWANITAGAASVSGSTLPATVVEASLNDYALMPMLYVQDTRWGQMHASNNSDDSVVNGRWRFICGSAYAMYYYYLTN